MKPLIYRHTTCRNNNEVTTIYILGLPVFRSVYVGSEERKCKPCGFTAYASDAPVEDCEDDTEDYDDNEQFIILPYGKET